MNINTNRILTNSVKYNGLCVVCLSLQGKIKSYSVARLVLEAFKPEHDEKKKFVVYKDGDKKNCTLSNLDWSEFNGDYNRMYMPQDVKQLAIKLNDEVYKIVNDWYIEQERKFNGE